MFREGRKALLASQCPNRKGNREVEYESEEMSNGWSGFDPDKKKRKKKKRKERILGPDLAQYI
jgi:hypothetical protein